MWVVELKASCDACLVDYFDLNREGEVLES
jgi:hypothetical protein